MTRRPLFVLLLAGVAANGAEPSNAYEALDTERLGRLFLSPEDRVALERRRRQPAHSAVNVDAVTTDVAAKPPAVQRKGAGLIVSTSGRPLVWKDGEFRPAESGARHGIVFPGTIRVQKSEPVNASAKTPAVPQDVDQKTPNPDRLDTH